MARGISFTWLHLIAQVSTCFMGLLIIFLQDQAFEREYLWLYLCWTHYSTDLTGLAYSIRVCKFEEKILQAINFKILFTVRLNGLVHWRQAQFCASHVNLRRLWAIVVWQFSHRLMSCASQKSLINSSGTSEIVIMVDKLSEDRQKLIQICKSCFSRRTQLS